MGSLPISEKSKRLACAAPGIGPNTSDSESRAPAIPLPSLWCGKGAAPVDPPPPRGELAAALPQRDAALAPGVDAGGE